MVDRTLPQADLEAIALGEASLAEASARLAPLLPKLDERVAANIYSALRAWTWKTLEAGRRDEELSGWADLIGMVAAAMEDKARPLAAKLEAFLELLHASMARHALDRQTDPLSRKHVREIVRLLYQYGDGLLKQELMRRTNLREANLTRIMGPLIDRGWIKREVRGREVRYRLAEAGRQVAINDMRIPEGIVVHRPSLGRPLPAGVVTPGLRVERWGCLAEQDRETGPRNYVSVYSNRAAEVVGGIRVEAEEPIVASPPIRKLFPAIDWRDDDRELLTAGRRQ